jgi:hypothetical protein
MSGPRAVREADVLVAAAAIANTRGARHGIPSISNVLDMPPPSLRAEVLEDARAALEAAAALPPPAPRAGDVVRHRPTGETWTVAYVDGDRLAWCGWPPGEALLADCDLVERCTEEEHVSVLLACARGISDDGSDKRGRKARAQLKTEGIELVPHAAETVSVRRLGRIVPTEPGA